MFWHVHTKSFIEASITYYMAGDIYIVPIDPPAPPEPQYRPYTASELEQLVGKVVRGPGYVAMITGAKGHAVYCQGQVVSADQLLENHAWLDGGKCGVKVDQ
jgi:hypothetical protein